ncbi:hypothetical protein J2Y69_002453 [Microbacterium resistens]|uniref:Secreted protein n=1 Tax=Microbacterium resistens TaxID=156977 RepID=A0ABU1SE07_9MICO|nr:hypothetical protein [Microbacterium resistens]MDR6867845.1 hypothetical protein [Microbacterium resistens]
MGEHPPITRRTIIKGAAWSVPVIATAVATPAATASVLTGAHSVGSLVESSPNIKDSVLSASSSRVESCFPNDMFRATFALTATVTYNGADEAFSLSRSSVTSAGAVWTVTSRSARQVTMTAVQMVGCYSGITGFDLAYNAGAVPPLGSLTLNIAGVSADGTMKIDNLVSAIDGYAAVVGPKVHDS